MGKRGHRSRRRSTQCQSLAEFALLLPIFLFVTSGMIDFGRYVYTQGVLNGEVARAARLVTLATNQATDCAVFNDVLGSTNGIINAADPHSISGDMAPGAGGPSGSEPSTPPAGQGYAYIYPAVATGLPVLFHCSGAARPGSSLVTVQLTYTFVPWTPVVSRLASSFIVTASSTQTSEY